MAKDGIARPMLTTDTARNPPRRTCPSHAAGGMATTAATRTEASDIWTCAHVSAGRPLRPDQAASLPR